MGYDLHITRRKYWFDKGLDITAEEWARYVESDPELRREPKYGEYHAQWSGPSKYPDAWLDWFQGCVYTKNPDEPLLRKMLQIAAALGARVQGDDGEIYRSASFDDCYHED